MDDAGFRQLVQHHDPQYTQPSRALFFRCCTPDVTQYCWNAYPWASMLLASQLTFGSAPCACGVWQHSGLTRILYWGKPYIMCWFSYRCCHVNGIWEHVWNMNTLLTPFEQLTREINEWTASAADVIPSVMALKRLLNKTADTDRRVKTCKSTLLEALNKRVGGILSEPLLCRHHAWC
jgi:hypothetical protein